jgi:membrane-bound serine protease (ClpP class)
MSIPARFLCLTLLLLPLNSIAAGKDFTPVLSYLTNPNIAYLLLLIGIYGVFFEFTHPGLIIPGLTGILSLIIVTYVFPMLPIDYFGLVLILLGIGFMITEAYTINYGVIALFGIIAFILGSVLLFDIHQPHYHISIPLILVMSIITFLFLFIMLSFVIQSRKRKFATGNESLIGHDAVVLSVINEQILVRVLGEIWNAKSADKLKPGDAVHITHVQESLLTVKLMNEQNLHSR